MLIFKICPTNAHCRSNVPFLYIIQEYVKKNWLLTPLGSPTFQNPKWLLKAFSKKMFFPFLKIHSHIWYHSLQHAETNSKI